MKCPHCDTPIDDHAATRCLDAWVAEVIMGQSLHVHEPSKYGMFCEHCHANKSYVEFGTKWGRSIPPEHYSTDISAAWEVMDKEHPCGWFDGFALARYGSGYAIFRLLSRLKLSSLFVEADTAPLAICRAATKACQ
jgi:hypothetical protein